MMLFSGCVPIIKQHKTVIKKLITQKNAASAGQDTRRPSLFPLLPTRDRAPGHYDTRTRPRGCNTKTHSVPAAGNSGLIPGTPACELAKDYVSLMYVWRIAVLAASPFSICSFSWCESLRMKKPPTSQDRRLWSAPPPRSPELNECEKKHWTYRTLRMVRPARWNT